MGRFPVVAAAAWAATCWALVPTATAQDTAMPGSVWSFQKISETQGGFTGVLDDQDRLGRGVAALGDLNGDGVPDLLTGSYLDDDGGPDKGAAWVILLNADGSVKSHTKISAESGGFHGELAEDGDFGLAVAVLGDVDGDGVTDVAIGAPRDNDGAPKVGAVWVLFLRPGGNVKGYQKISSTQGGMPFGAFGPQDQFGRAVAGLGDLDGDGVPDLGVGNAKDRVRILFLNSDGTVKAFQEISGGVGGFTGALGVTPSFGSAIAAIGDVDGDGVTELVVGENRADNGGFRRGTAWLLYMNQDGTVHTQSNLSGHAPFTPLLDDNDNFGTSAMAMGDLDGDGVPDIGVGAPADSDGGNRRGAIWILFLRSNGSVKGHQKISATAGDFYGNLENDDRFGVSCACLGDLDGDDVVDIASGAYLDDDGFAETANQKGAVWILQLEGTVWGKLDGGLGGTNGVPQLKGLGTLEADTPYSIDLTGALENAPAQLAVGVTQLNAPFKGGVMVPMPLELIDLVTDPRGAIRLQGDWPEESTPGANLYLQFWISDPGALLGFSATPAIVGTTN